MSFQLKPLWNEKPLLSKYDRLRKQADIIRLSAKAKQKIEWFAYYELKSENNVSKTARYFGIAPKTFYKWHAVFDPTNLHALEEGSRAPHKRRQSTITAQEEDRILTLRKANPEFGKMKIRTLYHTEHGEWISSWKVQKTIEKYSLQRKPAPRNQSFKKNSISKRKTIELKKKNTPGFLVAFDSIVLYRNGKKFYIVTGIDTISKVAWARAYTSHSSTTAKDLFQRLYIIVRGNILNVCHDNGTEFEKEFSRALKELKIPQYYSRIKTPKDNPVCERFNGILKQEFLRQGNFSPNLTTLNKRLTTWLIKYNTYRPHQSLNYLTPVAYLKTTNSFVTDVPV